MIPRHTACRITICLLLTCLAAESPQAHPSPADRVQAITRDLATSPHPSDLLVARAQALREIGRWLEALRDLAAAEHRHGANAGIRLEQAYLLASAARWPECASRLDEALALEPEHLEALAFRSRVREQLGLADAALADAEAFLKAHPHPGAEPVLRVDTLAGAVNRPLVERLRFLEDHRSRLGPTPPLVYRQAELLVQAGDVPGAITLFESLDPEATRPAWLLLRLGDFLVAHGRTLEAQSLYTEGLDRVDGSSPGLRSTYLRHEFLARLQVNPEPETRP